MIRDEALASVTAVSACGDVVYVRTNDVASCSTFDRNTGKRLSGTLDLDPEEVRYLVWRQKQSPGSEAKLREKWRTA